MAGKFEIRRSTNGKFHFNLKAGNVQEIGRNETYSSDAACDHGIEFVKENAPIAETVDTIQA